MVMPANDIIINNETAQGTCPCGPETAKDCIAERREQDGMDETTPKDVEEQVGDLYLRIKW